LTKDAGLYRVGLSVLSGVETLGTPDFVSTDLAVCKYEQQCFMYIYIYVCVCVCVLFYIYVVYSMYLFQISSKSGLRICRLVIHVQSCPVMSSHVQSCPAMSSHVQPCPVISSHVQPCPFMSSHVQS